MKIISLQMKNNFLGWDFDEVNFSSSLTLLVGVSGAGKTQVIRSIKDLRSICQGVSINGLDWKITFAGQTDIYLWEGSFSTVDADDLYHFEADISEQKPKIINERFYKNSDILIERSDSLIVFNGKETPKLASNQSALFLLKEEELLQDAIDSLKSVIYRDYTIALPTSELSGIQLDVLMSKFNTLDKIKNNHLVLNTKTRLFLSQQSHLPVFELIKNRLCEIFPQVEDFKIETFKGDYTKKSSLFFWIKEKDVSRWIGEGSIASGMLRSIVHLGDIFLSNEDSVILIDEFENSLGINCIDVLTDDIMHENKNLQFIATSHHPYIINNIPYEYWKIVTRKGGHININDASDYKLGKSKQEAFMQLTKVLENQF